MEGNKSGESSDNYCKHGCTQLGIIEDETQQQQEDEEEEEEEILKKRILAHPLFSLLVETHLNCLKVGLLVENGEDDKRNATKESIIKLQTHNPSTSDLDLFMEAYCITLEKLKEAMEEPLQETTSFIKDMYKQLREMNENHPKIPKPNSSLLD